METIYISIPSLNDTETKVTIENAIASAKFPDRVYIGVSVLDTDSKIYKEVEKISKSNPNVSCEFNKLNIKDTSLFGTGRGRKRAADMYTGQDYMLQVDSHTLFEDGWDVFLIDLFKEAKEFLKTDRFVFTGYLGNYSYDKKERKKWAQRGNLQYPFYITSQKFLQYIPGWDTFDDIGKHKDKFIPCVKFNGNFAFGNKEFVNNSGLDENSIFYDEEVNQSINLIGNDFAMVFPIVDSFPLAHLYSDNINKYGGKRNFFSNYVSDKMKKDLDNVIVKNYINFINNPENEISLKKYSKYARIDYKRGVIAHRYVPKSFTVKD